MLVHIRIKKNNVLVEVNVHLTSLGVKLKRSNKHDISEYELKEALTSDVNFPHDIKEPYSACGRQRSFAITKGQTV